MGRVGFMSPIVKLVVIRPCGLDGRSTMAGHSIPDCRESKKVGMVVMS